MISWWLARIFATLAISDLYPMLETRSKSTGLDSFLNIRIQREVQSISSFIVLSCWGWAIFGRFIHINVVIWYIADCVILKIRLHSNGAVWLICCVILKVYSIPTMPIYHISNSCEERDENKGDCDFDALAALFGSGRCWTFCLSSLRRLGAERLAASYANKVIVRWCCLNVISYLEQWWDHRKCTPSPLVVIIDPGLCTSPSSPWQRWFRFRLRCFAVDHYYREYFLFPCMKRLNSCLGLCDVVWEAMAYIVQEWVFESSLCLTCFVVCGGVGRKSIVNVQ